MKFLPENKKKTIRSVVLLVVSIAGIIYFIFFTGPASQLNPPEIVYPAADPESEAARTPGSAEAVHPLSSSVAKRPPSDRIDASILESDDFQALRGTPELTVSSKELGKDNPFSK